MRTEDIKGARPNCIKFVSKRNENPLNPRYRLQSVSFVAPEPLKYIKDPLRLDDIPGSKAVRRSSLRFSTRDVLKLDDIMGTQARRRHRARPSGEHQYDNINYRDVTHADFKSTRTTNPLMPTYLHKVEDNKVCEIGPVFGSTPNVMPVPRKDLNFVATSLKT